MNKKPKLPKPVIIYEGIKCDSDEEKYCLMWLFELKRAGYVESIERAESFTLAESVWISGFKTLKTKVKEVTKHLMRDKVYTPDFKVIFTAIGALKFLTDSSNLDRIFIGSGHEVLIEVKPVFDQHGKTAVFHISQKWVYQRFGKYVNEFIPADIFKESFYPREYLLSISAGKRAKIKKVQFLNDYLNKAI